MVIATEAGLLSAALPVVCSGYELARTLKVLRNDGVQSRVLRCAVAHTPVLLVPQCDTAVDALTRGKRERVVHHL